ncbi:hypothetical protein ACF06L_22575 [Streptomyces sp. NPDC015408]|uniref:hypothetical protein n=1 Tax=Streptomyces sp. NPDC015408 TaxID=3364956 RepID=UPI0036F4F899
MRSTAQRRRTVALCGALAVAGLLTGCGDSGGDDKPAGSSTAAAEPSAPAGSASASGTQDPQAADEAKALAVYRAMWTEQAKAYRKASEKDTELTRYASLDALGMFRLDLEHMRKSGTVTTAASSLGHDPEVTAVDLDAGTPTATVTDCIDLARWQTKRVKTGELVPLPSEQPRRYQATATLERWDGGRWMVVKYTPHGERSC